MSAALTRELAAIVGDAHVRTGAAATPFACDATVARGLRGVPDAVVLPRDAEQVAALVDWAVRGGVPLVPRGGGSGLAGGAVPVEGGVVVALDRLTQIGEISPEAWRMTVGAGVRTADVHRLAREHGLLFPPDPGAAEQSQIGGNVATNAGGPHAFKYGATGAWVLGLEAVVPPGDVVRVGGPRRKDVGGYDLVRLLVGSEGTLGIITEVTLRLVPAPESVLPLVAFCADATAATQGLLDVVGAGIQPATLDYLDGWTLDHVRASYPGTVPPEAAFVLLLEADGSRSEAAATLADLREALEPHALQLDEPRPADLWRWRDGVSGTIATARGGKLSEDIVVPPERLADAVAGIQRIGAEVGLPVCSWGHAGDGNLHPSVLIDPQRPEELARATAAGERFFALAIELGGAITGEHGIGWCKRGELARQWTPETLGLQTRIRAAVDPTGIMNPGKKD